MVFEQIIYVRFDSSPTTNNKNNNMKKIKLSIVGLLLSGLSYGQTVKECCVKTIQDVYQYEGMVMSEHVKETVEQRQALDYRINDLINAIRMDAWYGKISNEVAQYYTQELAAIRDVNVIVTNGIAIYGVNEE